jgi:hypothetical protein
MIFQNFSSEVNQLLYLSSESTLNDFVFKEQRLTVNLSTYQDDDLTIYIETDTIKSSPLFLKKELNICRLVICDMHEILKDHNGYYIPPENFSDLMKFSGKNYSLFYGMKKVTRYCISFIGSKIFITCPIKELSDITWVKSD